MKKLFLGDWQELIEQIPDKSIDLVCTDPPYGITRNKWDQAVNWGDFWKSANRIMKENSNVVIFSVFPVSAHILAAMDGFKFRHELIWFKNKATNFLNSSVAPMRAHENILVFGRGNLYNSQPWTSNRKSNAATKKPGFVSDNYGSAGQYSFAGGNLERKPISVLEFNVLNNDDPGRVHPTQKPIDLIKYLISTYSNEGSIVFDPFMGSGTTIQACVALNRGYVGSEIDETYFNLLQLD